jgi:Zn-dependent peptidase ImmA (M78 family)
MISIKPTVFFWLLDKSGYSIPEIADKIEYEETEILKWKDVRDTIKLPLSKVEIISKIIERPLSAFFMAEPPKDHKLPKDFRKLPTTSQGESLTYSKETLLAFRKASHLQEVATELLNNINKPLGFEVPKYTLLDNPEDIAEIEREKSGVSIDLQINLENATNAYGVWRECLATYGIFVFEFNMPLEDARGFCLIETDPKIVVVSKKDALRGRIFSLLHEYAHVLLRESVICNIDSDSSSNINIVKIENWCNQFAGAFLLPKAEIIKEYSDFTARNENILKFLQKLSDKYKISRESVLVRLRFLNLVDFSYYSRIKSIIESEIRERKIKEREERDALKAKGIEPSFMPQKPKDKTIWNDRGANFVSLVLQNSNKGYITERDVMDILELRVDHLMKLLPS